LFAQVGPGSHYASSVLPAAIVFGLGLSITVAPLTAAVLGAVDNEDAGIASGVNNAVARLAGLLAVALLPSLVGLDSAGTARAFTDAFSNAMYISAVVAALGGVIAWLTIRTTREVATNVHADVLQGCHDPACALEQAS
jgi:hypothetical protein